MVHTEVVLQGNGSKGLGCSLDFYMLFSLDSLMQSVRPATALHDTASLLVDNFDLTVNDHILVVLVEHAVSLEQLLQGMDALRLYSIVL